ncbi:hypothetical protein KHQ81_04965 [Mycoplasmatota bacterium]|nr:hypothetical protein KHQ81_04965 [Mycoplasmatota bacterium]
MVYYFLIPLLIFFIIIIKQLCYCKDKTKKEKRITYFLDILFGIAIISLLLYDTVISNKYTMYLDHFSIILLIYVISDIIGTMKLNKKTYIIVTIIFIIIYLIFSVKLWKLYNYKNLMNRPPIYHIQYDIGSSNSGNLVTVYNDKIYYFDHDKIYEMNKDSSDKKDIINADQLYYTTGKTTYKSNLSMSVNQNGLYYTRYDGIYLYSFSDKQITKITTKRYNYIHTIDDVVYLFNHSSYTKIANTEENIDRFNCEISKIENREVCMFKDDEFLVSFDVTNINETYFQVLDSNNNLIYRNKSPFFDYFTPLAASGEDVYAIIQGNLVKINSDNNVTLVSNLSSKFDKFNDQILLTKVIENNIYLLYKKSIDDTQVLIKINLSTGDFSTLYTTSIGCKVIDFSDQEIISIDNFKIDRLNYITNSYIDKNICGLIDFFPIIIEVDDSLYIYDFFSYELIKKVSLD